MKKSTVYLLIIAPAVLIFLGVLLWIVLGPSRPTLLSKQTTYLTRPLRPNGLVDYEQALFDLQSADVSPAENAAIPFLQATWPSDLDPADQTLVCAALQMPLPTEPGMTHWENEATLQSVADWLNQQNLPKPTSGVFTTSDAISAISEAMGIPWKRTEMPPLADWIDQQAAHFDKLREINDRPKFFLPSPQAVNDQYDPLLVSMQPTIQTRRALARDLAVRSMLNLGENRPEEAWKDIQSTFELSRCYPRPGDTIDLLVGMALRGVASAQLETLLASGRCDAELLDKIERYLAQLSPYHELPEVAELSDRFDILDAATNVSAGNYGSELILGDKNEVLDAILRLPYDRNAMLRTINQQQDQLVAVLKIEDLQVREQAFDQFDADLQAEIASINQGSSIAAAIFNQSARGELIGKMLVAFLLSPLRTVADAEVRSNLEVQMLRIAVALEQYKLQTGDYPDSLDALADKIDPALLDDPYSVGRFQYQRRAPGYLLYSLYQDRTDNGGTCIHGFVINGEWVTPQAPSTYPQGDMVIRFPQPQKILLNPPPWIDPIAEEEGEAASELPDAAEPASDPAANAE